MELTGVHLLLTYTCTFECDHCFVWSGPNQPGTMTLEAIRTILAQCDELGTVEWVYFEGGEPFLYYATLVKGVELAAQAGYRVGIVSNTYWATSEEDALEYLRPLVGKVDDLAISSDAYHFGEAPGHETEHAEAAAARLGIPLGVISVAAPCDAGAQASRGQLPASAPEAAAAVMYRGRAAARLTDAAPKRPWREYDRCLHEDLADPGRVHIDPLGYVHVCQGIAVGNVFEDSLADICWTYDPMMHPIVGPILAGGPAELVRRYQVEVDAEYADECHLCYATRCALRSRFPDILAPDQMYGDPE